MHTTKIFMHAVTVHIITIAYTHACMYKCGFILHGILIAIICDVVMGALLPLQHEKL